MQQVISRDGTEIGFRRSGAGPPLLLVHGATADHTRWDGVAPRLEPHFTIYTLDRRGRGASGDSPNYSLQREAEDVAAVADSIDEPVFLLGHSYGGLCALEGALLTGNVGKLVLYEPDIPTGEVVYPPEIVDRIQALIDRGENEAAVEVLFREIVEMPEDEFLVYRQKPMWQGRIRLAPTILREMAIYQTYRFSPERFANLQTPTLFLLGGDSPQIMREATERANSALPNSQIVVLPGQQHIAMDTNPELFVREVMKFLVA
jgi:pimeloyl-ACP methyl ester carboxylesterase